MPSSDYSIPHGNTSSRVPRAPAASSAPSLRARPSSRRPLRAFASAAVAPKPQDAQSARRAAAVLSIWKQHVAGTAPAQAKVRLRPGIAAAHAPGAAAPPAPEAAPPAAPPPSSPLALQELLAGSSAMGAWALGLLPLASTTMSSQGEIYAALGKAVDIYSVVRCSGVAPALCPAPAPTSAQPPPPPLPSPRPYTPPGDEQSPSPPGCTLAAGAGGRPGRRRPRPTRPTAAAGPAHCRAARRRRC
jgi:hypothetical protein